MPRPKRHCPGGYLFHILNRSINRTPIFQTPADYQAFADIVKEGVEKFETRILSYSLMPNHWHFVLWPRYDDEVSKFIGWVSNTHTRRYRVANKSW